MPRLVLYDDNGAPIFDAPVSPQNVERIARFLRNNMGALRAAAAVKNAVESLVDGVDQIARAVSHALPPARPRARPPAAAPPRRRSPR